MDGINDEECQETKRYEINEIETDLARKAIQNQQNNMKYNAKLDATIKREEMFEPNRAKAYILYLGKIF